MLFSSTDNLRIEKLAYDANMSIKTFERKFTEQVGVSPKLFVRMIRFNKALSLKVSHSKKSWTSIAHMCGYFDQMHLIKEFILFSGETPSHFFKDTPPPEEYLVKEQQRK
jgi:transcriptional regulator GlxA family with amidase domain